MSIWRHVRLAGSVLAIIGVLANNLSLNLVGLVIMAAGVVGAVDRLERELDERLKEKGDVNQD